MPRYESVRGLHLAVHHPRREDRLLNMQQAHRNEQLLFLLHLGHRNAALLFRWERMQNPKLSELLAMCLEEFLRHLRIAELKVVEKRLVIGLDEVLGFADELRAHHLRSEHVNPNRKTSENKPHSLDIKVINNHPIFYVAQPWPIRIELPSFLNLPCAVHLLRLLHPPPFCVRFLILSIALRAILSNGQKPRMRKRKKERYGCWLDDSIGRAGEDSSADGLWGEWGGVRTGREGSLGKRRETAVEVSSPATTDAVAKSRWDGHALEWRHALVCRGRAEVFEAALARSVLLLEGHLLTKAKKSQ